MSMDNPHEENRTRKPYMTWAGLMFAASILFSATSFQLLAGICVLLFLLFAIIGLADKYVTNRGVPVRKDRALNIFAWLLGFAAILTILLQLLIPAIYSARMAAPSVLYYENGQKKFEGHHKNGKPEGRLTEWWMNGQKAFEAHHKNGQEEGLWTYWYESGQEKLEVHFKNDKPDGLATVWDENGNKTLEVQYKDGEEVSRKEF